MSQTEGSRIVAGPNAQTVSLPTAGQTNVGDAAAVSFTRGDAGQEPDVLKVLASGARDARLARQEPAAMAQSLLSARGHSILQQRM